MTKKGLAVVNPISGNGRGLKVLPRLVDGLKKRGLEMDVHVTRASGDARGTVAEMGGGYAFVLAVGGDGTLNEVINGLGRSDIPVAQFPVGTANVLAQEFSLPRTVGRVCDAIASGRTVSVDLGVADGWKFVVMAGVGLDAEVCLALAAHRTGRITMASYLLPILRTLTRYTFPPLRVEVDGELVAEDAGYVIVANGRRYGGPFEIALHACATDGLLDVCVMKRRTHRDFIRYMWGTIWRSHLRYRDVLYRRGTTVAVTSPHSVPFQLDGDAHGRLPATFGILPSAVSLVVP